MLIILLGIISGFIGGMGIGGGTILIPGLILITGLKQQTIQSVNLVSFIPVALIALRVHTKNRNVDFRLAIPLVLLGLLGAWIGSSIALKIPSDTLRRLFGIFLLSMGIYELIYKGKNKNR
ncbi:sulfite exporter TauE/SafE family protein [Alkaliphilus serpentinus]|uniref:Probable membrane transporter protein n=1 Tax=Alkaliphilus serpentinus TaxID=1482731 RepID=A0A833HQ70_9FIRM|nr:sulfite exporter TauE/SafE family protein [Alkaliphilus serpentinus]KAB3531465.1 sulfite exporter TauE/SafE family protein [Alkaliphilus serpentinus]